MLKLLLFSYFFNRMLQNSYVYYPDLRPEPENYIKCSGTNEMREEVEALEKKLFLEESHSMLQTRDVIYWTEI